VVVVTDADAAGEKAAARILSELAGVAARVARVNPLALLPEPPRNEQS
jgi:DNA primase